MRLRITSARVSRFRDAVLAWYADNRRDLPWRDTGDPWQVLVSEVMLQQTQVVRVIPKYRMFIHAWPTPKAMACASPAEVLRAWSGLGYNRRGLGLLRAARSICDRFGGSVPAEVASLRSLPGVGPYTAGAVASFAFGKDVAVCDTNIRRMVSRYFFGGEFAGLAVGPNVLGPLLQRALPSGRSGEWHSALMDFGSAVCTGRTPACATCPLRRGCRASKGFLAGKPRQASLVRPQSRFQGSVRQVRGRILREVLHAGERGVTFAGLQKHFPERELHGIVGDLEDEGLVAVSGRRIKPPPAAS